MGQIERRLVKPEDLEALNAPADGLAPVFNASARKFEWKSAGGAGGAIPQMFANRTGVTFPFSSVGPETVASPEISFPTPFDVPPAVIVAIEGIDVHVVRVEPTHYWFRVYVRDDAGVDYTSPQYAIVNWIAIRPIP
jgi:hypothetical protein